MELDNINNMEIDIDKLIGGNLKRIRNDKGVSQMKLAEMVNTPASRLSSYEKGRAGLGKGIMMRVCKVLNVHPYEFYLEPDTPIIRDETEMKIIKRMRSHPEIKSHLDAISRALIMEIVEDTTIPEEAEPAKEKEA